MPGRYNKVGNHGGAPCFRQEAGQDGDPNVEELLLMHMAGNEEWLKPEFSKKFVAHGWFWIKGPIVQALDTFSDEQLIAWSPSVKYYHSEDNTHEADIPQKLPIPFYHSQPFVGVEVVPTVAYITRLLQNAEEELAEARLVILQLQSDVEEAKDGAQDKKDQHQKGHMMDDIGFTKSQ